MGAGSAKANLEPPVRASWKKAADLMLGMMDIGKNGNRYANFVQNDNDLTRRKRQM